MTCAGCPENECPQDAWHLHVTVQPHWSWSLADVTSALEQDIVRHGIRPVVVTNRFHSAPERDYRELIPTKHVKGTEADATRQLFNMGVLLNNAGWRVKRLKVEGDASRIRAGRALYYEAHVKFESDAMDFLHAQTICGHPLPISTNAKGNAIVTLRDEEKDDVEYVIFRLRELCTASLHHIAPPRIEAIVLDTAPDMDKDWIEQ